MSLSQRIAADLSLYKTDVVTHRHPTDDVLMVQFGRPGGCQLTLQCAPDGHRDDIVAQCRELLALSGQVQAATMEGRARSHGEVRVTYTTKAEHRATSIFVPKPNRSLLRQELEAALTRAGVPFSHTSSAVWAEGRVSVAVAVGGDMYARELPVPRNATELRDFAQEFADEIHATHTGQST